MSDVQIKFSQNYLSAVNANPDYVMVQVPPLAVIHTDTGADSYDGWHHLLAEHGFTVTTSPITTMNTSSGVTLRINADQSADLVVQIPGQADGSYHLDPDSDWSARVLAAGHTMVLFTQDTLDNDGNADGARLTKDIAAGAVWGAQVRVTVA